MTPNLTAIANDAGSDKGDVVFHAHGYSVLYSFLFEQFREQAFAMLEIGLKRGGLDESILRRRIEQDAPSIRMWRKFFPRAQLFGFDISDFSSVVIDGFTFLHGDAGSAESLAALRRNLPRLKLIVDDGSHASYHQQLTFAQLFERLLPGGFYVIEDIHVFNPMDRDLPPCPRTIDVFESFVRTGHLATPLIDEAQRWYLQDNIANVFIHRSDRGGVDRWSPKMLAVQRK